ncbi:hypothetical protein G9A89_004448, partial [Geosiphon pyriformis]
ETNQEPFISNIFSATIMKDKSLAAIFLFKLKKSAMLLFNEVILNTKFITVMYTNTKVNSQTIKLILNSGLAGSIITQQLINQLGCQVNHAVSTRIIMTNKATKTPIDKIDDFSFEINGIITPIKVLVMKLHSNKH